MLFPLVWDFVNWCVALFAVKTIIIVGKLATKASLAKLENTYKVKGFTAILCEFRANLLKELEASI